MTGSEIAILAGKQLGSLVAKKFGTSIVERWTRHRAQSFFAGFLEALAGEIAQGVELEEVDRKLDQILEDEARSEVLFDAYRSVCFSRTKTVGPKIIGLLAGAIVIAGRTANEDEEQIFRAAESLSDSELYDFFKCYRGYLADAVDKKDGKKPYFEHGDLVVPWSEDVRDSAWSSDREIDTSPLNVAEALGAWGARLEQVGMLTSRLTHRRVEYDEDGERHIDQEGVLEIYAYLLVFHVPSKLLCQLFERALGATKEP